MSDFKAKVHKNRFAGGTYCARPAPSWNKGDLLLREGDGAGRRRGGEGGENRGEEREGKGVERPPVCTGIFKFSLK